MFERYINARPQLSDIEQANSLSQAAVNIMSKSSQMLTESALNVHQDPQELSFRQLQQSQLYGTYADMRNKNTEDK